MLANELDVAMSSAAPVLEDFRESGMARQDRGGFVGGSGPKVVTRSQAVHALVESRLVDSVTVRQLDHFVELPRP